MKTKNLQDTTWYFVWKSVGDSVENSVLQSLYDWGPDSVRNFVANSVWLHVYDSTWVSALMLFTTKLQSRKQNPKPRD